MKARRRIEQARAFLCGYFWLPCPICGEEFSGREWGPDYPGYLIDYGHSTGVCKKPSCLAEARRRDAESPYRPNYAAS